MYKQPNFLTYRADFGHFLGKERKLTFYNSNLYNTAIETQAIETMPAFMINIPSNKMKVFHRQINWLIMLLLKNFSKQFLTTMNSNVKEQKGTIG